MRMDILRKKVWINIWFFDSTDENKELLKKCNDVFNGIGDKIKAVMNVIMKKIV